jgi:hypothetical protein
VDGHIDLSDAVEVGLQSAASISDM